MTNYQTNSIYKLINDKEKHGILLWWSMGTGKTIAGITYVLNFDLKIIVICPDNIKFIWEEEFKNIKVNDVKYYHYNNIDIFLRRENLKGYLVIVDEAHNLIPSVEKKNKTINKLVTLLNTSSKVVLLTGTPIYDNLMDIVYLINIAAGKKIIPYNYSEFKKKYYLTNKFKMVLYGYYKPMVVNISSIFKTSAIMIGFFKIFKDINGPQMLKNLSSYIYSILNFFDIDNIFGGINLIRNQVNNKYFSLVMMVLVFFNMYIYLTRHMFEYKINEIKYLDIKQFAKDIERYVSIYDKKNITNFPVVNIHTKYVPYNSYQLSMWINLTQDTLDLDTIKRLEINNMDDVEYHVKKIDSSEYLTKGILIGNLNNDNIFSPKFYEIQKISRDKKTVIYSSSLNSGIIQFKNFLEFNKINYLFLDVNSDNNYTLKKFKEDKNYKYLLLHPKFNEGISIHGAEQLHLLEIIDNISKRDQVISRVVRFDSHLHLSVNKRTVDVYQWVCESKTITSKLQKLKVSIKKWIALNPEVFYKVNYLRFEQDITPDSIFLKKLEKYKSINDSLISNIEKFETEETVNCCINFPSNEQFKKCMKKYNETCKQD